MKLNFIKTICKNSSAERHLEDLPMKKLTHLLATISVGIEALHSSGFSAQQIGSLLEATSDLKTDATSRIQYLLDSRSI